MCMVSVCGLARLVQFTTFLDVIGSVLTASGSWLWERLDGTMSAEVRKQSVARWKSPGGPQVSGWRCSHLPPYPYRAILPCIPPTAI
jgi:hypothetical protein